MDFGLIGDQTVHPYLPFSEHCWLLITFGMSITTTISDHSNDDVVQKHYIAQSEAVKKTASLKIFPE